MPNNKRSPTHHRPYQVQEIALGKLVINPRAQRVLMSHRVHALLANFDLDFFGEIVVSWRDGKYFILDGQHRVEAMKRWLGDGWEIQKIPCRVYQGLREADEADMFDRLNDCLTVSAFDKFKARVNAGREIESQVAKVVKSERLLISREKIPGAVGAVTTLVAVFKRGDGEVLAQTLRIIRDAFGDAGFEARLIDGLGHFCQRYGAVIEENLVIAKLRVMRGGSKGLLGKAEQLHRATGNARAICVAAAAVDVLNAERGGTKLPSWWKAEAAAESRPVRNAPSAAQSRAAAH
jgi:Family of unknown function (DUF6551)